MVPQYLSPTTFSAIFVALIGILMMATSPVSAQNSAVDPDLTCKFRHTVHAVDSFDDLPAMVQEFLRTHTPPEHRFIRAAEYEGKWYIANDTRDKEYPRSIFGFVLPDGPTKLSVLLSANYDQGRFCQSVDDALDGRQEIPSAPSEDISCVFHHAVQDVASFDQMPVPIVRIVEAHSGALAKRDTYFNHIDVVSPGDEQYPYHRFIRGGRSGERWFLAFESGGYEYEKTVVFFALRGAERPPKVLLHFGYYDPMNLCEAVDSTLAGKTPQRTYIDRRW